MEKLISVAELQCNGGQFVDVRTPSEFATGHIAGAVNVPLDEIESRIADLRQDVPVVLICKGGTRARVAANLIAPCRANRLVLEGGMDAWYREGHPVVTSTRTRWSLERQVRLVAGVLVLTGAVLAIAIDWKWVWMAGFIGAGLTFAGSTDVCPMGMLLGRMPWNRNSRLEANRDSRGAACLLRD